jgi:hypothetical protein
MVHDDITGQGSFASSLQDHPQFQNIFDVINNKDGLKNNTAIALYDTNGDEEVNFKDFMTPDMVRLYWEKYDPNSTYTEEEVMEAYNEIQNVPIDELMEDMGEDEGFKEIIETMAKEKLSNAILNQDHPSYNENVTKDLLVDFMTNRQRQMFYGGDERYKELVPGLGETVYKEATKKRKGELWVGSTKIESLEAYKKLGGSLKYLEDRGYYWDKKDGGWMLNKGAQFYNADPNPVTIEKSR